MSKEQDTTQPPASLLFAADDVEAFHYKYGIEYEGPKRTLPEADETGTPLQFRIDRLQEEVREYAEAARLGHHIPDQLDAMLDLIYIALGNLHLQGFTTEEIEEGWRRVQVANMSKVLSSKENPGKHGNKADIVKPPGWVAPCHDDIVMGTWKPGGSK